MKEAAAIKSSLDALIRGAIAGLVLLLGTGMAAAQEAAEAIKVKSWKDELSFKLEGEVEVGGQTLSGHTGSPTLKEYRDLVGKPTLNMRLKGEDKPGTRFVELGGANMTRTDAFFFLNGGWYNAFKFDFDYNRQPHIIGLNRSMIYTDVGLGDFRLSSTGCGNVAAFNDAPGTDPAQRNAIEAAVNCLLRPADLGHQTDTARIGFRGTPLPDLELKASYSRMNKDGTRPFSGVFNSPGSNVMEFAAPRQERIHEMNTGAEYATDWYQLRFNYDLSLFQNNVQQVGWENVCGGSPSTGAGGCRNPDPGLGRTAMMPDNYAHSFSSGGGLNLPWWESRLTAGISYGLWRQNQTFLPVSTLPGATNISNDGAVGPNAAMNVLNTNLNLTSRPLQDVTVTARYRYYNLDNNTPVHRFANVPREDGTTLLQLNNLPISFRKQNVGTDVAWRITSKLTAKAGYEWEHWGRSFREVAELDEHIAKGSLDYRPLSWITSRLTYSHGVRAIGGQANAYLPPATMVAAGLPQFRKFDQADRTRDKGEFFLQVNPLETVTVSGTFYAQQDHFFNTSYGLQDTKAYGYSSDVSWTPSERWHLFAGYAHDDYQARQQNCGAITAAAPCNPANTFFAKPRDILDTWNAGMNLTAIPNLLDLNLDYRYTFGRSKFGMAGTPGAIPAAQPAAMPDIKNIFHVVNASTRYYVTPQWTLKMVYLYERYRESDFTVDNVTPSLANVTVDGFTTAAAGDVRSVLVPIQHPAYEAHFVGFSAGYKF